MAEEFGLSIILKMIDDVNVPLRKVGGAFDKINKKYNEVLKKLEKEFINMSSVTSHAADDLMRMAAVGSDLGIPTKDLKDFAKFAMDLSIATDIIGDEGIRNFNALA